MVFSVVNNLMVKRRSDKENDAAQKEEQASAVNIPRSSREFGEPILKGPLELEAEQNLRPQNK